ncbi:hypothetical protein JRQ81_003412 [Phrynocephalus forsythii]|uniref:Uncharacterized protein n=1 Tax=Phrynocephalus forsythii TaxID=171643 RepID=A0A9Q1AXF0_9SAUR|nr:hypothetical protein JRQ81_003412 [Phrynocephalus forsythii]
MYQRSRAVAGRLGPRCPWRWEGSRGGSHSNRRLRLGQGDDTAWGGPRARPRDLDASWHKLLLSAGSIRPTFQPAVTKKPLEAPSIILAPSMPPRSHLADVSQTEPKASLSSPRLGPEDWAFCRPPVLVPLEGLPDAITVVNGRQEDDIEVQESEGLDLASLDSLHNLFHGWQFLSPYPPSEVALGPFAPFQATSGNQSPVSSPGKGDPSMEEHLAVMYEKLRNELPTFLVNSHDFRIYSQDVEFVNEILHLKTRGHVMYRLALLLCRLLAWTYFVNVRLEVLSVTQHPENWSIQARWRLVGLPFHVLLLRFYKDKQELYRMYDAYSTFSLNSQGLIKCHRVSKLMPSQPLASKLKKLAVASLLGLELSDHRPSLLLFLSADC